MIRINLLPSGKKRAITIPPTFIYGTIASILMIVAIVVFTIYLNGNISKMESDIFIKEKKLNELKVVLKEVENYEKDNQEFRMKADVIEQLRKNQIIPLRLLDEVSERLPKGVWLNNIIDKGGSVSIRGYAFSNSDLVSYVQNLKGSKFFVDVMLVESRQKKIDEYMVYQFKLTFKVKV